jgi:hypothetical protein
MGGMAVNASVGVNTHTTAGLETDATRRTIGLPASGILNRLP